MFSTKSVFTATVLAITALSLIPTASAQTSAGYSHGKNLPHSSAFYGHNTPGDLPAVYLQLACVNCQKGEQTEAARYIEKAIAELGRRSRDTGAQTKSALSDAVRELKYRSRQLRAGHKVTAKQLEGAFARATQSLGDTTIHAASHIGYRSTRIYDAASGFGHSIFRDAKNDAKYLGARTQLFGGRVTSLAASSATAVAGH